MAAKLLICSGLHCSRTEPGKLPSGFGNLARIDRPPFKCRMVCLLGIIVVLTTVADQFSANSRRALLQKIGNISLSMSRLLQGVNLVSFTWAKCSSRLAISTDESKSLDATASHSLNLYYSKLHFILEFTRDFAKTPRYRLDRLGRIEIHFPMRTVKLQMCVDCVEYTLK